MKKLGSFLLVLFFCLTILLPTAAAVTENEQESLLISFSSLKAGVPGEVTVSSDGIGVSCDVYMEDEIPRYNRFSRSSYIFCSDSLQRSVYHNGQISFSHGRGNCFGKTGRFSIGSYHNICCRLMYQCKRFFYDFPGGQRLSAYCEIG